MGYVIGDTEGLSTWGKCRRVAGQNYQDIETGEYVNRYLPDFYTMHCVVYYSHEVAPFFRTTKGSGWMRGGFMTQIPPWPGSGEYPFFGFSLVYYGPDGIPFREFYVPAVERKEQPALLAQEVYVDSGIIQIEQEAFANNLPSNGQQIDFLLNGPVYEVGNLTPV